MNATLQDFAREQIMSGLKQLPPDWQTKFKWMYGRNGGKRTLADAEAMALGDVVYEIPENKLDWAMQQIENSIRKLKELAS